NLIKTLPEKDPSVVVQLLTDLALASTQGAQLAPADQARLDKYMNYLLHPTQGSNLAPHDLAALLFVRFQCSHSVEAVRSLADLADLLSADPAITSAQAVEICSKLIDQHIRALEAIASKDSAVRKQLARLHYRKCKLIREHSDAQWPFADCRSVAFKAIN